MTIKNIGPAGIPNVGFGTYLLDRAVAADLVQAALSEGYTHIDTAQTYENEAEVGDGIRRSGMARDKIFLTTKILPENFSAADFKAATEQSLKALSTDYVDLMLLHWPSREVEIAETIGALNELIAEGKVRHGGVSNFTIDQVKQAQAALDTPLAANQVEMHPFIDQSRLLPFLAEQNIPFEAYSPLAQGAVAKDPLLQEIAEAHNASAVQVALAWTLSKPDAVVLPKTETAARLAGNLAAAELELSAEEIARIDTLAHPGGRIVSPDGLAPDWD